MEKITLLKISHILLKANLDDTTIYDPHQSAA